jgi:hypothetical protein
LKVTYNEWLVKQTGKSYFADALRKSLFAEQCHQQRVLLKKVANLLWKLDRFDKNYFLCDLFHAREISLESHIINSDKLKVLKSLHIHILR